MTDSPVTAIPLIIVGILLVVAGLGAVLVGYGQMQAAQEWDQAGGVIKDPETGDCFRIGPDYERTYVPCENPYSGGGTVLFVGAVLVGLGGTAIYYGTH